MLVPTEKLKNFIDSFASRNKFSELIQIDEAYLSRLYNHKQGASANIIEKINEVANMTFEEAWEMIDDN